MTFADRFAHRTARRRLLKASTLVLSMAALGLCGASHAQSSAQPPVVALSTSMGEIRLALDPRHAPRTVENFLAYVRAGHYDGTIFHRVIPGFMVQGGGYTAKLTEKATRAPIPLEARNGLKNVAGSVAMARTANPDSATSQFFINTVDNPNLDYPRPDGNGYAVFGKVVSGFDVVKRIEKVPTGQQGNLSDVPDQPVLIEHARVVVP